MSDNTFKDLYEQDDSFLEPQNTLLNSGYSFKAPDMSLSIPSRISDGTIQCTPMPLDLKHCKQWFEYISPIDRRKHLSYLIAKERMFLDHFLNNVKDNDPRPYIYIYSMVKNFISWSTLMKVRSMVAAVDRFSANDEEKIVIVTKTKDALFNLKKFLTKQGYRPYVIFGKISKDAKSYRINQFKKNKNRRILLTPHSTFLNPKNELKMVDRLYFLEMSTDLKENIAVVNACLSRTGDDLSSRLCVLKDNGTENRLNFRLYNHMMSHFKAMNITKTQRSYYYA